MKSILACTRVAGIAAMFALVGGCANQNSIFRYNRVSGERPVIVTMDAKQRNTVMVRDKEGKDWRMCAEASPDVFSALSTSASADLGFGQSGSQTEAQAKAAIAIAEAAGTIERTQTINMLRESMYRTCERYLSGGIDKATFVVQAGRDWRAMIAILAIEQLTRSARPPSTIISAGSTSAKVESGADVLRQLALAQDEEKGAGQRVNAAKAAQQQAGDPPDCTTAPDVAKAACAARAEAVANAQSQQDRAQHNLGVWETIANNPPAPLQSSASTGLGPSNAGGSTTDLQNPTTQVAYVVGEIVRRAFETDETQLFCLQVLQDGDLSDVLKGKCLMYLMDKVDSERGALFRGAAVRDAGIEQSIGIQAARLTMAGFIRSLPPQDYEAERAAVAGLLNGRFCEGRSQDQCIDDIHNGEIDLDARRIPEIVSQRGQARRQR